MELTENQKVVLNTDGHLLVTGGPGSGKTTVSILKAAQIAQTLTSGKKVLFLSFARATVSRVIEAIEYEHEIPRQQKKLIDVETYHSFFWRILKAHGYLLGLPRKLSILTPSSEAVALSELRNKHASEAALTDDEKSKNEHDEQLRLAVEKGEVCFDLFSTFVSDILHGSEKIQKLIATMYPIIILDEFQDTNEPQWSVVQALGKKCVLLALADPEQRIYDWIGADPERLNQFSGVFNPVLVDLSTDNHRSHGTDILLFGNDILKGKLENYPYKGVDFYKYNANLNSAKSAIVTHVYKARERLIKAGKKNWSVAVLVPTKKMTRFVSDAFRAPPAGMAAIRHTATIEMEGAILAGELLAFLMQPDIDGNNFEKFIGLLMNYFRGKGGATPTVTDLRESANILKNYEEFIERQNQGKEIRRTSILKNILSGYEAAKSLNPTGIPDEDWKLVRETLEKSACKRLRQIAQDSRNLRVLDRGSQLRDQLSQDWRDYGAYLNAHSIVQETFVREHFSTNSRPETGVIVMNMHKAKGKQFDEVIIFESWPKKDKGKIVFNGDRIVRENKPENIDDQARQNFRVSVTRGKSQTTILTPDSNPCVLLI